MLTIHQSGRILSANPVACGSLGHTLKELLGKRISDIDLNYPLKDWQTRWEELRRNQHSLTETLYRTKEGRTLEVEASMAHFDIDGTGYACVSVRDIRHRRQAERERQVSEKRFRKTFDNEPACITVINMEGMLIDMNPAGLALIEADSIEAVIGTCIYDVIAPEYRKAFNEASKAVCRGESRELTFEFIGIKGTRRWMETHEVPVRDATNGVAIMLAITHDVTERTNTQEQLRQLRDELAHVSRLSTMGEMAMRIAHEMNQPLTAIAKDSYAIEHRLKASEHLNYESLRKQLVSLRE